MELNDLTYWDNEGESIDHLTVLFPDNTYISMNSAPYHPQGFCQHGEGCATIEVEDRDGELWSHLGKEITYKDLPSDCQRVVREEVREINDIEEKEENYA